MYYYSFSDGTIHGLSRLLIREINSYYYGKECVLTWIKQKLSKQDLNLERLYWRGVINSKLSSDEMKEAVAKEVKEATTKQVKGS